MITPLPQVGDLVDITLKGVRVTHIEPARDGFTAAFWVAVPKAGSGENTVMLSANSPAVTCTVVEPVAPAAWPPRLGDLWRDRDQELWFGTTLHVYQHGPDGDFPAVPVVELVHAGGGPSRKPDEVNRECGPLTLVRREDTADPAPPVEGAWPPRVGEVWKDSDSDEWTAIDTPDGLLMEMGMDGRTRTPDYVEDIYGPLTLIRRKQPGDGS